MRRYLLALGAVACLSVVGQLIVQIALSRQQADSAFINVAGRQRMLSQRITQLALRHALEPAAGRPALEAALADSLARLAGAHAALRRGDGAEGTTARPSPALDRLLAAAEADLVGLSAAARAVAAAADPEAGRPPLERLFTHEAGFLAQLDAIAYRAAAEASGRVARLRIIEGALLALVLLTLLGEGLFVFRPAIRALRQVERAVLDASEGARHALGRELHDGLCQDLAGLHLLTHRAAERAAAGQPLPPERLAALAELAGHALEAGRRLARGLSPVDLDAGGLAVALRELCGRLALSHGRAIECQLGEPDAPLPRAVALQLYRIAQEGLSNALRHADAARLCLTLRPTAEGLELWVDDDGHGRLPPDSAGLGLRSMAYRAQLIGARLRHEPRPGGGLRLRCALPLAPTGDEPPAPEPRP